MTGKTSKRLRGYESKNLDGYGRVARGSYKLSHINRESEYSLICFSKNRESDKKLELLIRIVGLGGGGLVISKGEEYRIFLIEGGIAHAKMAKDDMTILGWMGNKVYIIDNPFLAN